MTVQLTIGCGSSEIVDTRSLYHRRGWIGGTSARAWASVVRASTREVVSIAQGGSQCNPVPFEAALTGATHAFASVGSGHRSAAEVAEAVRLAWVGLGAAATRDGAVVTIPGASSPLIGGAPVLDAQGFAGRWGNLRYEHGGGGVGEATGPIAGTALVRVVMPAVAGRVLAIGCVGSSGFLPRLAVARGGTWATPGQLSAIRQGRVASGLTDYDEGIVVLNDPLSFSSGEALWLLSCSDGTGTQAYHLHGDTPFSHQGNLTTNENMYIDSTRADPTVAFGSTYTPTLSLNFAIYGAMFVIVECAPFRADGRIQPSWIGAVRPATGGTPGTVVLANEAAHFRIRSPQIQRIRASRARLAVGTQSALEGFGVQFYGWLDTDIPTAVGGELIGELARLDPASANAYAETTGVVELGTEEIGDDRIVSMGFNFGLRSGAGAGSVTQFVFDPPGAFPSRWLGGYPDDADATRHCDWITDLGLLCEYRTRASAGSTMPENDPNAVMPATFIPAAGDDAPTNASRAAFLLESSDPGWSALELAEGGRINTALLAPEVLDD